MKHNISYLLLEEETEELGLHDESHIQEHNMLSVCCQSTVSFTEVDCFCTICMQTLDPNNDLIAKSDEDVFLEEDYKSFSSDLLHQYNDFS